MKATSNYSRVFILSMDDFEEHLDSVLDEVLEPKSKRNKTDTINKRYKKRRERNVLSRRFYKTSGNHDLTDISA